MNAMIPTAVAALLLPAACGSNDGDVSGPTPPTQSVPNLAATSTGTNCRTQVSSASDG